jgi:hypothetical protein
MLPIHNATRKRERERIPSNQKPTETSIQCSQVATSAQQWELPRCAIAFRSYCTRTSLHSRPDPTTTIAQDDNNPGMSLQHSQQSPTCASQLIIPCVTRTGAAEGVPFLQRTRPRHAHPGEQSPHTRYCTCCTLRSGIASPLQLRSVILDTQTCESNGDSGMQSVLDSAGPAAWSRAREQNRKMPTRFAARRPPMGLRNTGSTAASAASAV